MIVYAINIHSGGGKIILDEILNQSTFGEVSHIFHDSRYIPSSGRKSLKAFPIQKGLLSRLIAELKLHKVVNKNQDQTCLFLGNLPPIVKPKTKSILFLQNALLLPNVRWNSKNFRINIRTFIERLILKTFIRNCDEIWVQSSWMKNQLEKTHPDLDIKIRPVFPTIQNSRKNIEKSKDYHLMIVSGPENHKRLVPLLQAILESRPKSTINICLVLSQNTKEIEEQIRAIESKTDIEISVHVAISYKNIHDLYSQSKALVVSSKFESFCLPIHEAKFFGLRRIGVDTDFLEETDLDLRLNNFLELTEYINNQ